MLADALGALGLAPRMAALRTLRSPSDGSVIDRALCLRFDGPHSVTGEDVVEFHVHGGRAVIERVLAEARSVPHVRMAEPGEFTLRAVLSGKMGLTEAEALADLIEAATEAERRRAARLAEGALAHRLDDWRSRLIALSALAEAHIDFSDTDDVGNDAGVLTAIDRDAASLAAEISVVLDGSVDAERLTDGYHIALIGPPNAGKSSLLNALVGTDTAIVSAEPGTTRDVVSVTIDLSGYRVTLHDTAGIRDDAEGVEAEGVIRSRQRLASSDLVVAVRSPDTLALDVGASLEVWHKSDLAPAPPGLLATSIADLASIGALRAELAERAAVGLSRAENALVTRARQRSALGEMLHGLSEATTEQSFELKAESLRLACRGMARMTGEIGIEAVLDDVFGRFCIGK